MITLFKPVGKHTGLRAVLGDAPEMKGFKKIIILDAQDFETQEQMDICEFLGQFCDCVHPTEIES